MSNINQLILFELNNAEQVLAKNDKFTDQNVQRVLDSGGYRGVKQYIKGLNTGSRNLQKRFGIKEKIMWNPFSREGAYTDTETNTIHLPFPLWNMSRVDRYTEENPNAGWWDKFKSGFDFGGASTALTRRHETDEARISQQIADRTGIPSKYAGMKFMTPVNDQQQLDPQTPIYYNNEDDPALVAATGLHASPRVLQNEKPHALYMSNFPQQVLSPPIIHYRNTSGEYGPSIQELTPKQIRAIEDQSIRNNADLDYFARTNNFNQNQYEDLNTKYGSMYVMTPYRFNPDNVYNAKILKTPENIQKNNGKYTTLAPNGGLIQNPNAVEVYK